MSESGRSITFVLPSEGNLPSGGFKVVYEYANALVRKGHRVTIVHPAIIDTKLSTVQLGKRALRYVQRAVDRSYRPDRWFRVDSNVHLLWTLTPHACHIPDADVIVATWWMTAEWAARYPRSKGQKFYLLQHLETWCGPEERVMATWRLPLHKIVIARWLYETAMCMGEEATYIPNGLDFDSFSLIDDPQYRDPNRVMMLHHTHDWKGSGDGFAALQLAHERFPNLKADIFGVAPAPDGLPPWIRYHRNPPQLKLRQLYNQAAIFLAPSWTEGWGLTASEAMQCGCAVLATDIDGHREFCIPGSTALLSQPRNPQAMAEHLAYLLQNREERIRLARSGHRYIQQFTWDRAADAFEKILFATPS